MNLIGGKMPGGFNLVAIKGYLGKTWGLGPLRSDGVLLLGLTMEPPKRLGSEAEAKAWLDSVTAAYARSAGISSGSKPLNTDSPGNKLSSTCATSI